MSETPPNEIAAEERVIHVVNSNAKPWYIELLQKQGVGIAILGIITVYTFNTFLPWVQVQVADMVSWHKRSVDLLQETSAKQAKTNEELVQQQATLSKALQSNSQILKDSLQAQKKLNEDQIPILREIVTTSKKIDDGITRLGDKIDSKTSKEK